MKYAKIQNGEVIQLNLNPTKGFIEVSDNVVCGQIRDGNSFINPPADPAQAERKAAHDAAAAVFESLPIGKQALWQPVRAAVADAILSGYMEKAKEILVTVPALYADAEEDRAKFLALFP